MELCRRINSCSKSNFHFKYTNSNLAVCVLYNCMWLMAKQADKLLISEIKKTSPFCKSDEKLDFDLVDWSEVDWNTSNFKIIVICNHAVFSSEGPAEEKKGFYGEKMTPN